MSRRTARFRNLDGLAELDDELAGELRTLFKALANDNRLRILHAVHREGELCVNDIAAAVDQSIQAVSNHLQRLADQGIVASRRDAHRVLYRIVDPCVPGLMDLGVCLVGERAQDGRARAASSRTRRSAAATT